MVIAQAGAIDPLVALLSGGRTDGVEEAAAGALRRLTLNDENQVAVARAGAISSLVALMR